MNKLVELLNEYETQVVRKSYMYPVYYYDEDKNRILNLYIGFNTDDDTKYQWLLSYIISKSYGFIKWLVDNDKIDQTVIEGNFGYFCMEGFDTVDSLLMVLAIQDKLIEYLISILK